MSSEPEEKPISVKDKIAQWQDLSKSTSLPSSPSSQFQKSATSFEKKEKEFKKEDSPKEESKKIEEAVAQSSEPVQNNEPQAIEEVKHTPKKKERTLKEIRMFLSSTFDDQTAERTAFQKEIFPRLDKFCKSHGWNFQVVDLRWGIRDESTDDHRTVEICMNEIKRCQESSPDCYFAVLLGNRYGWRPPAAILPYKDYEAIYEVAKENGTNQIFDSWYYLDENKIPAIYCLTPLNDENRSRFWRTDMRELTKTIHSCSEALYKSGKFTFYQYKTYTCAVTEQEVIRGIFENPGSEHNTVAFFRDIEGYNPNDPNGFRYANCFKNDDGTFTIDQESWDLQNQLKDKVAQVLPSHHVYRYKTEWKGDGIGNEYLSQLCEDFERSLQEIITKAMNNFQPKDSFEKENEHHESIFMSRLNEYYGNEESQQKLEKYLSTFEEEESKPIFVVSSNQGSGSGRTSLVTSAARKLKKRLESFENIKPIFLYRKFGTSLNTSSPIKFSNEICGQFDNLISKIFPDQVIESNYKGFQNPNEFASFTAQQLGMIATKERPVFIFISNYDSLYDSWGFSGLDCFKNPLPPHVRLVLVSDNTKKLIEDAGDDYAALIHGLSQEHAEKVLDSLLQTEKRQLRPEQRKALSLHLDKSPIPLYLRYLVTISGYWNSLTKVDPESIPLNVDECLAKDFSRIAKYHGQVLTYHALSYIALSKEGLSEEELIQILSKDETVLNDVLQYHKPDPRRLPDIVWMRLYQDLGGYFLYRNSFNSTLLTFSYTSVTEYIKRLLDPESQKQYYTLSSDFFYNQPFYVEEEDNEPEPEPEPSKPEEENKALEENSENQVDKEIEEKLEKVKTKIRRTPSVANLRKPEELIHHLIGAGKWEELQRILTNLDYIRIRCNYYSLHSYTGDVFKALEAGRKVLADLQDLHELILLLQPEQIHSTHVIHIVPPKRWGFIQVPPWKAVAPFQGDMMRHRGTRALNFQIGVGWRFFDQKFSNHGFPPSPHHWGLSFTGTRYCDPIPGSNPPGSAPGARPGMPGARPGAPGAPGARPGFPAAGNQPMLPYQQPFTPPLPDVIQQLVRARIGQGLQFAVYRT